MKRILLFLLTFLGIQAFGQNIVFADPVFKNSLITGANMSLYDLNENQLSNADADGNGEISEAEAENILHLSFTGMSGISDISGIQYFINLETLTGGGGMIGGVDLSGLTNLKSINLYSAGISSIILPDAENSALESLDLDANNITAKV